PKVGSGVRAGPTAATSRAGRTCSIHRPQRHLLRDALAVAQDHDGHLVADLVLLQRRHQVVHLVNLLVVDGHDHVADHYLLVLIRPRRFPAGPAPPASPAPGGGGPPGPCARSCPPARRWRLGSPGPPASSSRVSVFPFSPRR